MPSLRLRNGPLAQAVRLGAWIVLAALLATVVGPARAERAPRPARGAQADLQTNVTVTSYWVSNYQYFHSRRYIDVQGKTGAQYPDTDFTARLRSDFVGPMDANVNWPKATLRQQMSVRGQGWGMVDLGDGANGGPNGAWAWTAKDGAQTPLRGVWFVFVDRDLSPGSYPKIQIWPQPRPANWYLGYQTPYFTVPFATMAQDASRPKIAATSDFLPMGTVFTFKNARDTLNVPGMDAFLNGQRFEVLDIGVTGRKLDINLGLEDFEPEDALKHGLYIPGQTDGGAHGATIQILGRYQPNGTWTPQQ